ncbi:interferon-induced, double-stranded RNA-activated protein kinase isoform X2 [Hemicordylus capensis]|uniref:interferon-induced, double-stranded RNA-activated protein kinase isoform X2 n=1 Tax=Hemicordylus capensis TaxID=884348 RepID=UPI0023030B0A|nr:interferon-induced, double-stranded RNA-activated protein kinase isoform X2 [Hemicordylus capensis]
MAENNPSPRPCMACLNEYCQRRHLILEYRDVDVTGPPHDRRFTVMVVIDNRNYRPATGKTKKDARYNAAELAWETIQQETLALQQPLLIPATPPPQQPEVSLPHANVSEPLSPMNYIALLNDYALRNKIPIQYSVVSRGGTDHMPIFSMQCKRGDKVLGEGKGKNKQTAKLNAAKLAYEQLVQPVPRMARNVTPTNSSTSLSVNNSQGTSGTSANFVPDSTDPASNASDSVVFQRSGLFSNGADSDSGCKSAVDELVNKVDALQVNENPSPLANAKGPAAKPKRKETPLAPAFSKALQKEDKDTVKDRNIWNIGTFKDIEQIGRGGFGNVFKAKHAIDNIVYAVKRVKLTDSNGEESTKEVQALAKLKHENIVRYYHCWIGKDIFPSEDSISDNSLEQDCQFECLFICMEYCEKGTLKDWIDKKRAKESCEDDSSNKFQQIVEGVEYIHSQDLIHRDLKPENIFISGDDKIKIGDFGLVTPGVDDLLVERTANKGTRSYMAPEQVGSRYTKEVDIFPLGLIWFEMLNLFETGHERIQVWKNIRECQFPRTFIKNFPREQSLITKLLSIEPLERPSATELLNILKILKNKPTSLYTC